MSDTTATPTTTNIPPNDKDEASRPATMANEAGYKETLLAFKQLLFGVQAMTMSDEEVMQKIIEQKDKATRAEKRSLRRLIEDPPVMRLKAKSPPDSSGSSKHARAVSKVHSNFALERIDPEHYSDAPSFLLLQILEAQTNEDTEVLEFPYFNESDVSRLTSAAMDDAIKLAKKATGRSFLRREQPSLSKASHPDHFVIFERGTNDLILTMEDKQPFATPNKIPPEVQGQVYDYLMDMKTLGHSAPFAVLSTFSHSWLFWLENDQESTKIASMNRRLEHVQSVIQNSPPPKGQEAKENTPPPPELVALGKDQKKKEEEKKSEFVALDRTRNVMLRTEAYGSEQLVPLLYTAILCGLAGNPSVHCKQVFQRETYDGVALKLEEESYQWGNLQLKVGKPVRLTKVTQSRSIYSDCRMGTYFVIKIIGRGATSKAFEAYDHTGHRCVIKMYVKQAEDSEGKPLANATSETKAESFCDREVRRLETFYPFLAKKVFCKKLNKFHCVVMPFFEPLTHKERVDSRHEIEACLWNFVSKGKKKLKYSECDLRWRHVGYYKEKGGAAKEKKLVMFDLADLENLEKEESKDLAKFVKTQADALFQRLPSETGSRQEAVVFPVSGL